MFCFQRFGVQGFKGLRASRFGVALNFGLRLKMLSGFSGSESDFRAS